MPCGALLAWLTDHFVQILLSMQLMLLSAHSQHPHPAVAEYLVYSLHGTRDCISLVVDIRLCGMQIRATATGKVLHAV